MIRGRLRRLRGAGGAERADEYVEIDPSELSGLFAAPGWLRDAGFTAWLLVGVLVLLAGAVWLATLTQVILVPVIVAGVISAVAGQLVDLLARHGLPRGLGAAAVLLLIVGAGILAGYLVLRGIGTETSAIAHQLSNGADKVEGWLKDLGVSEGKAQAANHDLSSGTSDSFKALIHGLASGIESLASLAFFVAMTILSLFFLLKDGPVIRSWTERHVGLPTEVAHTITSRTLQSLRGYFLGVTIVAVFSAVLVGGAALVLGIPLAGTIAVVTFIGGYIPYLGAWTAGAFSVLIALGGSGPEAAGAMVAIQLLSNGPLQQIVQPVAYGAALGLHPLAVLVLTIAGGALFGTVGLILAAPIASAIVRISADLSRARADAQGEAAPA
ncbi:MAG TPA: AI-2E family transporter [Solirubrobacterales bacterium]|nr:AI-2E family transporter [Solirubrobacterales bacterium]